MLSPSIMEGLCLAGDGIVNRTVCGSLLNDKLYRMLCQLENSRPGRRMQRPDARGGGVVWRNLLTFVAVCGFIGVGLYLF